MVMVSALPPLPPPPPKILSRFLLLSLKGNSNKSNGLSYDGVKPSKCAKYLENCLKWFEWLTYLGKHFPENI